RLITQILPCFLPFTMIPPRNLYHDPGERRRRKDGLRRFLDEFLSRMAIDSWSARTVKNARHVPGTGKRNLTFNGKVYPRWVYCLYKSEQTLRMKNTWSGLHECRIRPRQLLGFASPVVVGKNGSATGFPHLGCLIRVV